MLKSVLGRDMYQLGMPGTSIDEIKAPQQNSLVSSRYAMLYWPFHLRGPIPDETSKPTELDSQLQDGGIVHTFIKDKFLYWLEALSLHRSVYLALIAVKTLRRLVVCINPCSHPVQNAC